MSLRENGKELCRTHYKWFLQLKLEDLQALFKKIEQRLNQLTDVWEELKAMSAFLAKIEEEEAGISEKQQLLTVPDLEDNMAAVQGLIKKHDAFETDLTVHGERCTDISEQGQILIEEKNHHADVIVQHCEQLRNKVRIHL